MRAPYKNEAFMLQLIQAGTSIRMSEELTYHYSETGLSQNDARNYRPIGTSIKQSGMSDVIIYHYTGVVSKDDERRYNPVGTSVLDSMCFSHVTHHYTGKISVRDLRYNYNGLHPVATSIKDTDSGTTGSCTIHHYLGKVAPRDRSYSRPFATSTRDNMYYDWVTSHRYSKMAPVHRESNEAAALPAPVAPIMAEAAVPIVLRAAPEPAPSSPLASPSTGSEHIIRYGAYGTYETYETYETMIPTGPRANATTEGERRRLLSDASRHTLFCSTCRSETRRWMQDSRHRQLILLLTAILTGIGGSIMMGIGSAPIDGYHADRHDTPLFIAGLAIFCLGGLCFLSAVADHYYQEYRWRGGCYC